MLYKIRAYPSKHIGESGRYTPDETCQTGDYKTASHVASQLASSYGSAVIVNTDTGNREWFSRNRLTTS